MSLDPRGEPVTHKVLTRWYQFNSSKVIEASSDRLLSRDHVKQAD